MHDKRRPTVDLIEGLDAGAMKVDLTSHAVNASLNPAHDTIICRLVTPNFFDVTDGGSRYRPSCNVLARRAYRFFSPRPVAEFHDTVSGERQKWCQK